MPKFRLININSKLKKLLTLSLLLVVLNSCDQHCVQPYQFDSINTFINAKPTGDGIFGGPYNNTSGGENAAWHPTGLRTDGGKITLEIRGAWTAWDDANNQSELNALPECTICAKKSGVDNCICKVEEVSKPEINSRGEVISNVDCSPGSSDQENPSSCTCTNAHGTINDFGTYFIATDYQEKSEALKLPDEQNPCRYTRGLGLYIGLFGKNGNTMPLRVYQVYPTQEVCDITRDSTGKCVDSDGNDQTKYVYESPNDKMFIKDDKAGNNGTDNDSSDDEYHQPGEFIKFIINDRYYQDNYGGYDINLMGGFLRQNDSGLLEYIVGTVEDLLLGKISDNGQNRTGGILEFLYNAIVKDSVFIRIVQMCLIMYVMLFGIWVVSGNLQISNKEMSKRILKIALVIFFTTESSWYFYNQIVVGFFKDGMDAVIAIFMDGSDRVIDKTSLIYSSQLDRANSLSYSTRFAYVDLVIKKLLASSTSEKIWSLFFGEWFGLLYIPIIYALIFAFIYIMLSAAFVYISALLRLIFVLSLGPIFMVTVLFNKTDEIFKRWLSFMASQTIQMICLFLIIYLFVVLIDVNFNDLLFFEACTKSVNFGLFNINFMQSKTDRGLVEWVMMFAKIATLLFLLKMVMEKIPGFAGHLVSVIGQAADTSPTFVGNTNNSAFGLAKSIMGKAMGAAYSSVTKGLPMAMSAGLSVARATGLNNVGNSIRQAIPFRGPVGMYRDHKIDSIIKDQRKAGIAAGKKGAALDEFIRKGTHAEINKRMSTLGKNADGVTKAKSTANSFNILGVNDQKAINDRLNKKLVEEPLKKAVKNEIDAIKKECIEKGQPIPLGKAEMSAALRPRIEEWAKNNSSLDKSKFLELLDQKQYGVMVKKQGELTTKQAAKMFAGNEEGTKRYLDHLQHRQFEKEQKKASGGRLDRIGNAIKDGARGLQRNAAYNPKMARENFLRKAKYEEARQANKADYNAFQRGLSKMGINPEKTSLIQGVNVLDKISQRKDIAEMSKQAQVDSMVRYLKDGYQKDVGDINARYDKDLKALTPGQAEYKKIELRRDEELQLAKDKHDNFVQKLGEQHNELKVKADEAQAMFDKTNNELCRSTDQNEMDNLNRKIVVIEQKVEDTKVAFEVSQKILNDLVDSTIPKPLAAAPTPALAPSVASTSVDPSAAAAPTIAPAGTAVPSLAADSSATVAASTPGSAPMATPVLSETPQFSVNPTPESVAASAPQVTPVATSSYSTPTAVTPESAPIATPALSETPQFSVNPTPESVVASAPQATSTTTSSAGSTTTADVSVPKAVPESTTTAASATKDGAITEQVVASAPQVSSVSQTSESVVASAPQATPAATSSYSTPTAVTPESASMATPVLSETPQVSSVSQTSESVVASAPQATPAATSSYSTPTAVTPESVSMATPVLSETPQVSSVNQTSESVVASAPQATSTTASSAGSTTTADITSATADVSVPKVVPESESTTTAASATIDSTITEQISTVASTTTSTKIEAAAHEAEAIKAGVEAFNKMTGDNDGTASNNVTASTAYSSAEPELKSKTPEVAAVAAEIPETNSAAANKKDDKGKKAAAAAESSGEEGDKSEDAKIIDKDKVKNEERLRLVKAVNALKLQLQGLTEGTEEWEKVNQELQKLGGMLQALDQ